MLPICFVGLRASGASVWREHKIYENQTQCSDEIQDFLYSKARKYVDSRSVKEGNPQKYPSKDTKQNTLTAAGEDCILASPQCPSNYGLYYNSVIAGQFQEIIPVLDKNLDFFHVMQAFRSKIRL